jgi:hypothetical protein
MKFLGFFVNVHHGLNLKWTTTLQSLIASVIKLFPLVTIVNMFIVLSMFEVLKAKVAGEFLSIKYGI